MVVKSEKVILMEFDTVTWVCDFCNGAQDKPLWQPFLSRLYPFPSILSGKVWIDVINVILTTITKRKKPITKWNLAKFDERCKKIKKDKITKLIGIIDSSLHAILIIKESRRVIGQETKVVTRNYKRYFQMLLSFDH